jgi:hypothetical protein
VDPEYHVIGFFVILRPDLELFFPVANSCCAAEAKVLTSWLGLGIEETNDDIGIPSSVIY